MVDDQLAGRIRDQVDRGFDRQVDFTAELVKFPSVRGAEQGVQDFIAGELRRRGYAVDRWRIDVDDIKHMDGFSPVHVSFENGYSVVGAHRADNPTGRSLILNGHVDVVPPGPLDMWRTPPFEPRIEDGWMHGRGAGDMKAGVAAMVYALDALKRLGHEPAADVFVQTVIEEESTGNGALSCVQRGYRADAALIPEPMGEKLIRAQVGVIWFQLKVRGRPVHALATGTGANAIDNAYALVTALRGLEERWNGADRRHPLYADIEHPINLNMGMIHGGDWASSVPAWCTVDLRIAVFPDQDLAEARAEIEDCVNTAAAAHPFLAGSPPEIVYNGFMSKGYILRHAEDAEAVLGAAHGRVYDTPLEDVATTALTDSRFLGLYADTPAMVYGPMAENIHGFDERVDLESVRRNTQAIALFIADWCGLARA